MAKTKIVVKLADYTLTWTNGPRGSGECHVDVRNEASELIAEMAYPRIKSLTNTADIFSEQAALEAPIFLERKTREQTS